jgi:trimeric autotransporter adhesin
LETFPPGRIQTFGTRLPFAIGLVVVLIATTIGQVQGQNLQTTASTVTAAVSGQDTVRITSSSDVTEIRLEAFGVNGEVVFDSGTRPGNVIDWKAGDAVGTLGQGLVLIIVTTKNLQNKSSQRYGSLSFETGQLRLKRDAEPSPLQKQTLGVRRQSQNPEVGQDLETLTIVTEANSPALVVTTNNGQEGQVTSTRGPLNLGTGDALTGQDKSQVRIMPDGRVGIGTQTPEATLDVAGEIRARGGIRFDDGTLLTSAPAAAAGNRKDLQVASTVTVTPNLAGTGTANKLAKWTDNAGTLGDSWITEQNGNIGIGTSNPTTLLHIGQFGGYGTTTGLLLGNSLTGNQYDRAFHIAPVQTASPGSNSILMYGLPTINAGVNVPNQFGIFLDEKQGAGTVTSFAAIETGRGPNLGATNNTHLLLGSLAIPSGNFGIYDNTGSDNFFKGRIGIGTSAPTQKLEVAGNLKISGAGNALIFPDGSSMTTAGGGGTPSGTSLITAINDPQTVGVINDNRVSPNVAKLNGQNNWIGQNTFNGLSMNGTNIVNVANPVSATDAVNKAYTDANFVKFVPGAEQLSVGDANGTAPMINLRGGSTCCSGPGGHTPAWFKVFQNGSFVATGNLGIGVSPMEGKGYRTSWHTYKGAFRSGYADNEWDDVNVGFFSWAGGSNSTASGLYALAFGDTNYAESTSSIVFGSGNQVKGAAGFSAGAGNRVCDTYGVALGNNAKSGGPYINGKCDPDTFNIRGLAAVAIGYNVTADQDHTTAMGKFASNNGFSGTFVWSDGSAAASADTFRNAANNEFAARATGGFRFRTNLAGTTGCNLPAGSGVFNCTSSRYTKENFAVVNGKDVLSRLRNVPISTWNYISEGRGVRHMGPMAEDFFETFRLGTGNTSIGVQDLAGVSLSAIQELDQRTTELQRKTAEVEQLRQHLDELRSANEALEKRLTALEQQAARPAARRQTRR